VDEVFNLSPQHVGSEHKPPPPPPPPTRRRITTRNAGTDRVKGDDTKSPPHVPAVKQTPVEQVDEALDETTSDRNPDQDQVCLANLSHGTHQSRFSHPLRESLGQIDSTARRRTVGGDSQPRGSLIHTRNFSTRKR